jgi:hypothetical protein
MGKNLLPWALAGFLAIACLALLDRSCAGPDPAYWVEKAKYDQAVKNAAAKDAQAAAELVAAKAIAAEIIAAKDREIKEIIAASSKPSPAEQAKDRKISELQAKVESLEAQGDLAGALAASKAENSAWAEKFSLAERRHQDSLSALNNAWQVKFDAQVETSNIEIGYWKDKYNREYGLRLTSDSLRTKLEGQVSRGEFWKWVALGEPVVFGLIRIFGGK